MEIPGTDVQVSIHLRCDHRGSVVIATEELPRVGNAPVRIPDPDDMAFRFQPLLDRREPVAVLRRREQADSFRQERLCGIEESRGRQRRSRQVVKEHVCVPKVGHGRMAQVHDQVNGHIRDVARAEGGIRGHKARRARGGLQLVCEFDGLRAQAHRKLEADRSRIAPANDLDESVCLAHEPAATIGAREKAVPSAEFGWTSGRPSS